MTINRFFLFIFLVTVGTSAINGALAQTDQGATGSQAGALGQQSSGVHEILRTAQTSFANTQAKLRHLLTKLTEENQTHSANEKASGASERLSRITHLNPFRSKQAMPQPLTPGSPMPLPVEHSLQDVNSLDAAAANHITNMSAGAPVPSAVNEPVEQLKLRPAMN